MMKTDALFVTFEAKCPKSSFSNLNVVLLCKVLCLAGGFPAAAERRGKRLQLLSHKNSDKQLFLRFIDAEFSLLFSLNGS